MAIKRNKVGGKAWFWGAWAFTLAAVASVLGQATTTFDLQDVGPSPSMAHVKVWFTKPVDPDTAQVATNYRLTGDVSVLSATLGGIAPTNLVVLSTGPLPEGGATLTLTVNGIKDLDGRAIPASTSRMFRTLIWKPGQVLNEFWGNVSGDGMSLTPLKSDRRFPNFPTTNNFLSTFEFPVDAPAGYSINYANRISGWCVPPETTDYVFFISSANASWLYLSPDATPENRKLIARETQWSTARAWTSVGAGSVLTKRSDQFKQSEWPPAPGSPIHLEAGKRYYIEALHLAAAGGPDHVSVIFKRLVDGEPENGTDPAAGDSLGFYLDPNLQVTITQQPEDQAARLPSPATELMARDFKADDGGFVVKTATPGPLGPWEYRPDLGRWSAAGSSPSCDGHVSSSRLNSPGYTMEQDGMLFLTFAHRYSFEKGWDGGQVRLSINGPTYLEVPATNFTANGYATAPLISNGSVLANRRAFTGTSPRYDQDQFITSQVILGPLKRGDTYSIQFLGAWDYCASGNDPNWEIASFKLEALPMAIWDFGKSDHGYAAQSSSAAVPASSWTYAADLGSWAANVAEPNCQSAFVATLTSPTVVVPRTDGLSLNLLHSYAFGNDGRDAGQVRISLNGGPFQPVPAENFTARGYAVMPVAGSGGLQGQNGFVASSDLATSSAFLGRYNAGDKLAIQFVAAFDACSGSRTSSWQIVKAELSLATMPQPSAFTVQAEASLYGQPRGVFYQWQRRAGDNWVDIPDAITPQLRLFPSPTDLQSEFRAGLSSGWSDRTYSRPVKLTSGAPTAKPSVSISIAQGHPVIHFVGRLQSAANVQGPYLDVPGAVSPHPLPSTSSAAFFRAVH